MTNLTLGADVVQDRETVGGGNQRVWDAGVYNGIIDMVTVTESSGGATAVNVVIKDADPNAKRFPIRETFYATSGRKKGQQPHYVDKDGVKKPLPGFTAANRLCIAAVNKPLAETVNGGEKKMVNEYSYEAKKEIPQERFVLTELVGKPIQIAVQKLKRNKRKKDASGEYVDTPETYEINSIRYFADATTGLSAGEMADGITEATFMKEWHNSNADKVIDQTNKDLVAESGNTTNNKPSAFG